MKVRVALMLMMTLVAAGAQMGSVSGVIRDEQGAPIQGAQVTLTSDDNAAPPLARTSDGQGEYHFPSVATGAYHLLAKGQSAVVTVSAASPNVTVDLTLSKATPHPQFEASGIRGLIDPGGYSASSNAAAASGVIKGVADIQRTGNDPATKDSAPCSLEPALKKAAAEHPENVETNLKLGDFYLGHSQDERAISLLEHARNLDSADQRVLHGLAKAYLNTGRFEAAEIVLTTSSATQTDAETFRLLARAREGKGKFKAAAADYQAAAEKDPSEENLFGAGYELILAGLPKEAEGAFQAGLQRYPQSAELLIGLGSAQFLEGRAADAIPILLRAVELNPADPRPYSFLSQASGVSQADREPVHQAFARFLSVAPHNPLAPYYDALNLQRQPTADDPKIEALLKQAILLDPSMADAHFALGVLYGNQRKYSPAAQELESAVRLSPKLQLAHYRLALAYRETGQRELSAKEMQRFEELRKASGGQPADGDIDQFISVFAAPDMDGKRDKLCPGDSGNGSL